MFRITISVVVVLALSLSHEALACSCMNLTRQELVAKANSIFVAKVTAQLLDYKPKDSHYDRGFAAEVTGSLKGSAAGKITVDTSSGLGGDCGFIFEIGKVYTIYSRLGSDPFATNTCLGTHEGEPTRQEKRFLKQPK